MPQLRITVIPTCRSRVGLCICIPAGTAQRAQTHQTRAQTTPSLVASPAAPDVLGEARRLDEFSVVAVIEYHDHSRTTELTDCGGGHGWKVDDPIGELSYFFAVGLTETAAKSSCDVPLVRIGSLPDAASSAAWAAVHRHLVA